MKTIRGGIIAAGEGSRFVRRGVATPKALIPLAGKPLIGWVLSQFADAGIEHLTVIFNRQNAAACGEYIRKSFPELSIDTISENTASSFESFSRVLASGNDCFMLITTVDAILPPGSLLRFLRFAENLQPGAVALGITDYIDDEKPLYIEVDDVGKVVSLGERKSSYVTCGVYYLHASFFNTAAAGTFASLRNFLKHLVVKGVHSYGFSMGKTIDVDRPRDVEIAEKRLTCPGVPE